MEKMRKWIIKYYEDIARRMPRCAPKRMADIGPGVIAVQDSNGECDVFYDTTLWELNSESRYGLSHTLKEQGIGIIESGKRTPRATTIEDMMDFVPTQLSPTGDQLLLWHADPMPFYF